MNSRTLHSPMRVSHGKAQFDVELTFGTRDRLTIHVHPDQRVTAVAPKGQPIDRVRDRLQARAAWIAAKVRHFEQFKPLPVPRQYISGETLYYLGRQYRLRVHKANACSVGMGGPFLNVELPQPKNRDEVRALVQGWYRAKALSVLTDRVRRSYQNTKSMGLAAPILRLRRMRTRWGSCTKTGSIVLHPDLIMVPSHCIEYVIVHELCHREVLRHDRRFYALLFRYLPDWERRKERLDQFVIHPPDTAEETYAPRMAL